MERDAALNELKLRLKTPNLIKHSLAVEAIMRDLAVYLKDDVDMWGLAGLLHDIDLDKVGNDMSKHSIMGAEILENLGFDGSIVYAVKAHNAHHGIKRKRKMDKALYAADPISGLITASALILPSKKLSEVTVDFIMNRFNEKGFAKGVDREQIRECEELGLSMEEFVGLALVAMQKIAAQIDL